ncbi:MAG: endonuclease III domain-containing protein [Candidatus Krumholzibacteriota bacterium]|nr:endonuclease III domain-containing protein [Candidatus Krumholzibacteriota bacterium]
MNRENGMGKPSRLIDIFNLLNDWYGPRNWWPVTPPGKTHPEYTGGPENPEQIFEVAVGAVLTQNTSWKNAARAVCNLNESGILNPEAILKMDEKRLGKIIRPSGYYNMKAKKLKVLAGYFIQNNNINRQSLLELYGIGPETADSIMLYALNKPYFVVDAYTRRLFGRLGIIERNGSYETIRGYFEKNLPDDSRLFNQFHALIVEHAKSCCRKVPLCSDCPLRTYCRYSGNRV